MNGNILTALAAAMLACAVAPASAGTFAGTGNPAGNAVFSGGSTQLSFDGDETFETYSENGVTFGPGQISGAYAGDYNTTGNSFNNQTGGLSQISFAFAAPVSAFAFNWGAADEIWTVDLFDGASLLSSHELTPTYGSNAGEFFGFTAAGITSVNLSVGATDWVFLDNLTYTASGNDTAGAIPEPSSWAMMLLGFGLVGTSIRRRGAGKAVVA